MPHWIPKGWHCVTPRLVVEDPAAQVRFLKETFNAGGDFETGRPTQVRLGDSTVLVSGTNGRAAKSALLYVYVQDADATHDRALKAGARSLESPRDLPYGDRRAIVRDPCGNEWQIATHLGVRESL